MNKKGQSLVEVIVALGILAIVFAGVVSLIVRVVDLELMARDRTLAVSLGQKKLAEIVGAMGDGCTTGAIDTPSGSVIQSNKSFTYTSTVTESPDYGNGLKSTDFREVTVKVEWREKSGFKNSYELKQVVKK